MMTLILHLVECSVHIVMLRFNIIHDNHHSWSLQIKDVQAEDRGYYMCQVGIFKDTACARIGCLRILHVPGWDI
jgi:hypothetical protein